MIEGGKEWGRADLEMLTAHPIFDGLGPVETVFMSHNDTVASLGPGFEELGRSGLGESGPAHRNAAIASDRLRRYGFQFHPEVDDTVHGDRMIANFREIWQCPTVLVPLEIDGSGRELVIVRPIRSERGMTATSAPLPPGLLD